MELEEEVALAVVVAVIEAVGVAVVAAVDVVAAPLHVLDVVDNNLHVDFFLGAALAVGYDAKDGAEEECNPDRVVDVVSVFYALEVEVELAVPLLVGRW